MGCHFVSPRNLGLVRCALDDDHDGRHEATNRADVHVSWTGENSAQERLTCLHCGARLYRCPGHSGRYALTDRVDGTDIYGSGSECPKNERGHEVQP